MSDYDLRDDIIYDGTTENWPVSVSYSDIPQEEWDRIFKKKKNKRVADMPKLDSDYIENMMGRCR